MLDKSIRILNFDNSVINQHKLLSKYKVEIIDLSYLGPRVRLWINKKIEKDLTNRLQGLSKSSVTFLGSGDFHHVSSILISQFEGPLALIIFDFHPDWDTLPPHFGCGSWVAKTLKSQNIVKCIILGVSSDDISSWRVQSGNLASLKDNRLEIYPYSHNPSSVFLKKIPQNISLRVRKGFLYHKIYWDGLKGKNLEEFFLSVLKRLPTRQVYVSIDKDCLRKEYALTNWEEGYLSLDELLLMLKLIKENLDIVGLDITGDYSGIYLKGAYKKFFSKIDHPKHINAKSFPESSVAAVNEETNLKILELLI
jgi:hypothetical protein